MFLLIHVTKNSREVQGADRGQGRDRRELAGGFWSLPVFLCPLADREPAPSSRLPGCLRKTRSTEDAEQVGRSQRGRADVLCPVLRALSPQRHEGTMHGERPASGMLRGDETTPGMSPHAGGACLGESQQPESSEKRRGGGPVSHVGGGGVRMRRGQPATLSLCGRTDVASRISEVPARAEGAGMWGAAPGPGSATPRPEPAAVGALTPASAPWLRK